MRFSRTPLLPLIASIVILTGCSGGSSDSSVNLIDDPIAAPEDGIQGRVAARIAGAQLSVVDGNGDEIVLASGRTTSANGTYDLVFSEFAIDAGIIPPLIVTVDGTGATAVCDFDREGDNDCLDADGSFVPFGTVYNLPAGFELKGIAPTFPPAETAGKRTVTVNISAASDLATRYALDAAQGASITSEIVNLASAQALGIVEFVTGLTTAGNTLNEVSIVDLTVASQKPTPSLALALFGASLHGQVNPDISGISNYRKVLNRMGSSIRPAVNNQLSSSGSFLADSVAAFVVTASSFQLSLASPSSVLAGAIFGQAATVDLLRQTGSVAIALPAQAGSTDPLDQTKLFVSRLSEAMGAVLIISTETAFGGTANGAAAVYAEQLSLLNSLVSVEARRTLIQLDEALADALASGETELTGTNVSGVLAFDGDVVTMTTATSTTSNIQTGISVNFAISNGTRNNPGGAGTFNAPEITVSISQTLDNLTTQQLFEGALSFNMVSVTDGADADSLDYSGDLRTTTALEFSGDIAVTNLAPVTDNVTAGTYSSLFTFENGSTIGLSGQLESQVNTVTVKAGSSTVVVDIQTNSLTDMSTDLNLTIDPDDRVSGGVLTAGGTQTGTMDAAGIVSFNDDTATALPAPII